MLSNASLMHRHYNSLLQHSMFNIVQSYMIPNRYYLFSFPYQLLCVFVTYKQVACNGRLMLYEQGL